MRRIIRLMAITLATVGTASALAAVSADEAKELGGPRLTQFGAEVAGNKDGTIPAYTGEPLKVPACFNPKEPGNYCDPFDEKPRIVITAQNVAQYASVLTEGQKAMFKRYPDYKMNIYPTHRTAIYPKYVLDNTLKNATSCHGDAAELKITGCYGGIPFPIPKTGNQVLWNHLINYGGHVIGGKSRALLVDANGTSIDEGDGDDVEASFYYDPKITRPIESGAQYFGVRVDYFGPARQDGEKLVILQTLDGQQRVYQYLPGQRRVKLAPDMAYDTPSPQSGGASTMDEQVGFFGPLDRYDFKLIGKEERFIVYNDFVSSDYKRCPESVYATKGFPNPECTRWELHRVWHVQATLKPGLRHILPKRDFYFDEDDAEAGTADSYDSAGKLYRIDDVIKYPYYDQGYAMVSHSATTIDLQAGTWAANNFAGFKGGGFHPIQRVPSASFWSPDGMAGEGIR